MAVKNVLFVHGYSETSLGAYYRFPKLLNEAGINVESIVLSAFDSLDDQVSIADLAAALEDHVSGLEGDPARAWDTAHSAIVAHSTGALVARRWMLDRAIARKAPIPSHLITMAGANHGSTLAQAGKSVLGYVQKLLLKHVLSVGARVLTDLDYGSDFLLQLNRQWLEQMNDGSSALANCYVFSMGGDTIGSDPQMQLYWGTHEAGCDNTVRISGANLNYRLFDADTTSPNAIFKVIEPNRRVPHIVLHGYSHFGDQSGILGTAQDTTDVALQRVLQALGVTDNTGYGAVTNEWEAVTQAWSAANVTDPDGVARPDKVNATVVFSVFDRGGESVDDCMIAFLDSAKISDPNDPLANQAEAVDATRSVSPSINPHSPIHNNVQTASYSFYLNWANWKDVDHLVHVEAHSPSARVTYRDLNYRIPPEIGKLVRPNEFTYVRLRLDRDTDSAYALYPWTSQLDLPSMGWKPDGDFPPGFIPLPPRP
ncbi:MAG: hypothetical protein NVSMB5_02840 [Candidatus Velthaea sp.]